MPRTVVAVLALLTACSAEYGLGQAADPGLATSTDASAEPGTTVPDDVPQGGITGRVCAPDDATWVVGATVTVEHAWGTSETVSGTDGWFTLEGLPVGLHTVLIEKGQFAVAIEVEVFADKITELPLYECLQQGDVKIAVVTGMYDDIGEIISGLNLVYDTIDGVNSTEYVDFLRDPAWMAEYDMIFFNCGMGFDWTLHQDEVVDYLRDYVAAGGSVYASDWAYYIVEASYPAQQTFHGNDNELGAAFVGESGMVDATVHDPVIQDLLGSATASINYDLASWAAMKSTTGEVLLEGEYTYWDGFWPETGTGPLAFRMSDGGGTVTYTTFHNEHQTTIDMDLILQEIILSL